ncbi:class I SAM-dependent methyltransferase [Kineococcus sp. NPDC059986]|uniref:class I SAM-dependent methyltransferase n=1 Tax=Kineococcus sp. NPDC059986 TaxID=3155538 RepID=UPI00344EFF96
MIPTVTLAGATPSAPVTAGRLFELMSGYKATAVLRAAVRLRVFDVLAAGPATAADCARRMGTDDRGIAALLAALAGLELLTAREPLPGEDGGREFALAPGAAELLVTTSPQWCGGVSDVVAGDLEWATLGELARTVRDGGPVPGVDALAPDFAYWSDFATHTTFGTRRAAELLADTLAPWGSRRPSLRVLDLGAGHGLTCLDLLARCPQAHLTVLDWPSVLPVARRNAQAAGVEARFGTLAGDGRTAPLGGPYDLVVLGNLLFHFSAEQAQRLVARAAASLAPGGRLVVLGFTAGDAPAATEVHAAMLGLLVLSWTDGGRLHSTADHRRMLAAAGFGRADLVGRPGLPLRLLVARREEQG